MASKEKKNGGDFVLESRHLVGLFLLLVVIFGVVFTLGYLMGRSQYDSRVRAAVGPPPGTEAPASAPAAKSKTKPEPEDAQVPKKNSDWDFYHSADPQAAADHLQPAPKSIAPSAPPPAASKPAAASSKAAKSAKPSGGTDGPLIPKGAIMLQVAAVLHQDDALALAQALQQKKFPAFVLTPGADKLYRVQVGPYADNQAAAIARKDLEAKGFKSIIKR
jgi:septal ring-binding cell division protein DamX